MNIFHLKINYEIQGVHKVLVYFKRFITLFVSEIEIICEKCSYRTILYHKISNSVSTDTAFQQNGAPCRFALHIRQFINLEFSY